MPGNLAIQETMNEQPPHNGGYIANLMHYLNANPQFEDDFGEGIIVVLEDDAGLLELVLIQSILATVEEL